MIRYPKELDIIFDKLFKYDIFPIIVGGYIRDYLLQRGSKDIDIELYGISSYTKLEKILEEFGSVNSVGKSFGVCKLQLDNLELDFSFPRRDSKTSSGHTGFDIIIDASLDFKEASRRRDFTINTMGYDVKNKKILDPFDGLQDLQSSLLRAVDMTKFTEDPLRVLRAVQFSARFDFKLDSFLFELCRDMISQQLLQELPKERIFEELKKILFKAKNPSQALILLQELDAIQNFSDFSQLLKDFDFIAKKELTHKQLSKTLYALIQIMDGENTQSNVLSQVSKELQKVQALIQGRDLIDLGLSPSKEFGKILDAVYDAQIKGNLSTKEEAIHYVKKLLEKMCIDNIIFNTI
jgi:tRNA nucleotidyltransferase/poly(A) polymerase